MKRQHRFVMSHWDFLALGGVAACFIAGAALIGFSVGVYRGGRDG